MKCFLNRDYVENFIRYHKKTIIKVVAGFVLFAAAFFVFCIRDHEDTKDEFDLISSTDVQNQIEESVTTKAVETGEKEKNKPDKIYIDISGAVGKSNVYEMKEGARVYEAIELAGGLNPDADVSNLNLAQILKDEDKITVSTKNQIERGTAETPLTNNKVSTITNVNNSSVQENQWVSTGMININTAGSEELQTISGIGPSTAEKIISYRGEHGRFKKIEELMNVSGIGEKTFAKLKSKITV